MLHRPRSGIARQIGGPAVCLFHQSTHSVFHDDDDNAVGDNIIAIGQETRRSPRACARFAAVCVLPVLEDVAALCKHANRAKNSAKWQLSTCHFLCA